MKVTKSNYYSKKVDDEYMSYSQFKLFDECPAKAMAIIKGEYKQELIDLLSIINIPYLTWKRNLNKIERTNMILYEDTRNKQDKHKKKKEYFAQQGIFVIRKKLTCQQYVLRQSKI